MAKKPTAAGGYVTTRAIAINGQHYAAGEAVTDLSADEIRRALAHGWIIGSDTAPEKPQAAD